MISKIGNLFMSLVFISILIVGTYYVFQHYVWKDFYFSDEIELLKNEIDDSPILENSPKIKSSKPFAMLLLGVDTNNVNQGRTDSIVLALVDLENSDVRLISIPRDTLVYLRSEGKEDKINAAYAYDGVRGAVDTVQSLLDVQVDYYSTINLKGFADVVDVFGGIEVDVEKNMSFNDRLTKQRVSFTAGMQTLNGTQALNYSRFRGDGEGDFGRNRRQQQVIASLIDESTSLKNLPKIVEVIKTLGDNINTNLSVKDIITIATNGRGLSGDNVSRIELKGSPAMIGGVSYVQLDENSLSDVKKEIDVFMDK